jgi:hypothetical protein
LARRLAHEPVRASPLEADVVRAHRHAVELPPGCITCFEPRPQLTASQLAAEGVHGVRWWTLDELESSDAIFYPTQLAYFLRRLLEAGPPEKPIDVGV